MITQLNISTDEKVIGPLCDFTYSWCLNSGMAKKDADRFTIAVSELITDIILFAYPGERSSHFEVRLQNRSNTVEFIISEVGEPFDPDRHVYDPRQALENDRFEGAGFRLMQAFSYEFLFINKGKKGKEFRLSKRINRQQRPIDELLEQPALKQPPLSGGKPGSASPVLESYEVTPIEPTDAEDISKLIYRTYNYTYSKEDMYFPKKIEEAVAGNERMGVIARSNTGEAIGYFAVLRHADFDLAEVGEAVVSPDFRRRGIMGAMMRNLIDMARQRDLSGLFGKAVTIHPVSQKVNAKYGFKSTALMLAENRNVTYIGFDEGYPKPVSVVLDFLLISGTDKRRVYLPDMYQEILHQSYQELGINVDPQPPGGHQRQESSDIRLEVDYTRSTAQLIVEQYGVEFPSDLSEIMQSLEEYELNALYLDLPLEDPATPGEFEQLGDRGFIYSGLMPQFHGTEDYLRLQKVFADLDFALIETYSPFAQKIKAIIDEEYHRNR